MIDVYKRQGMRAPMGLKVSGPDLESIEQGGKALETALKDIPSILPSTVFYDRAVGAPYIEIKLNRRNMAPVSYTHLTSSIIADLSSIRCLIRVYWGTDGWGTTESIGTVSVLL